MLKTPNIHHAHPLDLADELDHFCDKAEELTQCLSPETPQKGQETVLERQPSARMAKKIGDLTQSIVSHLRVPHVCMKQ